MKASQVIVILFSVFLCLTGCEKYEVSSLDIEELEKVSEQYLREILMQRKKAKCYLMV